jgi:hypothetical protein
MYNVYKEREKQSMDGKKKLHLAFRLCFIYYIHILYRTKHTKGALQ